MISVHHSAGRYPVEFCSLDHAFASLPTNCVVVTDTEVAAHYGVHLEGCRHIAIPAGEGSKNLQTYEQVVGWMAENGANRRTTVVAFGGGVVGDLAGFVAATYMRGVPLVQIPTTLLAMVDSSVGGKVGVDLPQGKNLIGAFAAPEAVFVPTAVLHTLSSRQFRNGMAEVVKYGYIMDATLAATLAESEITVHDPRLADIIDQCIRHKAYVVAEDEYETKGLRAILNFGHTVGHAIEQVTGYGPILHGEAISIGMVVEARLAERMGLAAQGTAEDVSQSLERQGLPTRLNQSLDPERLFQAMRRDKKATGNGLAFSLVTERGRCKLYTGIAEDEVRPLLDEL